MTKDDFKIGIEFYTAEGRWRCTDIGARVVVAIRLNQDGPDWYAGPPFAVPEVVFDEYDLEGCSLDPNDFESTPARITQLAGADGSSRIPDGFLSQVSISK